MQRNNLHEWPEYRVVDMPNALYCTSQEIAMGYWRDRLNREYRSYVIARVL